jgi:SAM-dependent methyltransferase
VTTETGQGAGQERVRRFYRAAPYPDLGAKPKNPEPWLGPVRDMLGPARLAGPLRYLDAGCGTGHVAVGVAVRNPGWVCHGIDLSDASVAIARQLAERNGARVRFRQGSYAEPLPFDAPFDLITAFGTVHHTEDPPAALRNLLGHLSGDGVLVLHLYGKELDRGKFEIREVLDILEPDIGNVERRFARYTDLMRERRKGLVDRLLDLSPRVALRAVRNVIRDARRRRRESWSPAWWEHYDAPTAPWIDHFCHPLERTYNVRDVEALARESGLEVIAMLNQGREDLTHLPAGWQADYARLGQWDRRRLMELLDVTARSVLLIGRRG